MKKVKKTAAIVLFCIFALMLFACAKEEKTAEQQNTADITEAVENKQENTELAQAIENKQEENTIPDIEEETKAEPETKEFRHGDSGIDIKDLQDRLKELGYLNIDETTDFYGDKTEAAVRRFQSQHGLAADGIAGTDTLALIYSGDAEKCTLPLAGYVIGIDPGHQAKGNSEKEPVAPGSNEMKAKVSSGTSGRYSGVDEYIVNLDVALLLRDMLVSEGADVIMTHETADVDISNIERAQIFNAAETDYAVRIHCNGIDDTSQKGAFVIIPTENPYIEECRRAAEILIDEYCELAGFENDGVVAYSNQTGFNWCERMVVNIEMGHMSNEHDDMLLTDPAHQQKMAEGIKNGILAYFS